ncbi:MAG: adenosylhomocysteinase [Defluviitaleaceae bacterium]|nr:adenosylhomocysteinase [Defluviitaleaceae bacterium]
MSIIRNAELAEAGRLKIDWARSYMPVLKEVEKEFTKDKPFSGKTIAMSIHLEAKTANLALVLREGGADVRVTGCNPLSTQDDVCAGLASHGIEVFAWRGATKEDYTNHLIETLRGRPHIILDDGGDLMALLHGDYAQLGERLIGGTEETTTGVHRLRLREKAGSLKFPMLAVNDARCKHLFDNRYGTGQSTWSAILHRTNMLIAGKYVVVAGFGWCGRGIAMRAKSLGARVIITEVDPIKALEAHMEGYDVMSMDAAAGLGDIFITVSGVADIIVGRHMEKMKDGVILCNAGHFDSEISKPDLKSLSVEIRTRRPEIEGYKTQDGRWLNLISEGRLVNIAADNGHPIEIMDLSFAVQAKALRYMAEQGGKMPVGVHLAPAEIDTAVAAYKLHSLGIKTDILTEKQKSYIDTF